MPFFTRVLRARARSHAFCTLTARVLHLDRTRFTRETRYTLRLMGTVQGLIIMCVVSTHPYVSYIVCQTD